MLLGRTGMSNSYAAVSALIFAAVAIAHLIRIMRSWAAHVGPYSVPMSLSWIGLAVAALLAIWGFVQLG
jgi:hypothetical protein